MSLENLCQREVIWVDLGSTVKEAAELMESKNIGSVVVAEGGRPLGIVTDRDIVLRVVNKGLNPEKTLVDDVMTDEIFTLNQKMGLLEALDLVKNSSMRRFPIVDDIGFLTGIITLDDIVYLLGREMDDVASIVEKERPRLL